jgi:hypothetical protein
VVDVARAAKAVSKMTMLKFFPTDPNGQKAIVELCCKMATETEQVEWLVRAMLTHYNEWPGPREMRGMFCQRYKPADGGPNVNMSQVFPNGLFPGCAAEGMKELSAPERQERRQIEQRDARRMLASISDAALKAGESE